MGRNDSWPASPEVSLDHSDITGAAFVRGFSSGKGEVVRGVAQGRGHLPGALTGMW